MQFTFDCDEVQIKDMITNEREKDNSSIWTDSEVEILINPSGDLLNYYHWMINSKGVYYDASCKKIGSKSEMNPKWDSGCEVKVTTAKNSWQAIMTLDKSKCAPWNEKGFVVNFGRHRMITGKEELYTWTPFSHKEFHDLERCGKIVPAKMIPVNTVRNGHFLLTK